MYPIKFKPVYKSKVWGGRALEERLLREIPEGPIGESWELAAHEKGESLISNGPWAGETLSYVLQKKGESLLGTNGLSPYSFPLLVKILDVESRLSIQVHPGRERAKSGKSGKSGKSELWYILGAREDARVLCGVKPGVTRESFKASIRENRLEESLTQLSVEEGDVLYIPAGTVHSIKDGVFLVEIQQSSDETYRIYDWDREERVSPRPLHIREALKAIDFNQRPIRKTKGLPLNNPWNGRMLALTPYFVVESMEIDHRCTLNHDSSRFSILMCTAGEASFHYKEEEIGLKIGETLLLPLGLDSYRIEGPCRLLNVYIEDIEVVIRRLRNLGHTREEIAEIAGMDRIKL